MEKISLLMKIMLFFLFFYSFATAQDEAKVYSLPASKVVPGDYIKDSESTEITSKEWEGKNLSLADLLSSYAGIQTRKQGGMGSFQSLSIRGMQGNQIAVAIDGVVLQNIAAADLGSIDLNNYEKIEIYKGFIPPKFAANGMGGLINLISKDAAAKGGKFYASYSSYNTKQLSLQVSSPLSDSLFWISNISYRASDNSYSYLNRNGTEYNTKDDFETKRKNAEYFQISGNHSFRFAHNKLNTVLNIGHNSSEGGIPGREDQETKTAKSVNDALLASYEIEPGDDNISFGFLFFTGIEKNISKWNYLLDKIGYNLDEYTESGILLKNGGTQGSFYLQNKNVQTELHAYFNYQYLESRNKSAMLSNYELSNSLLQFSFAGTLIPADFFNITANASTRFSKEKRESGKVSGFYMDSEYNNKNDFRNLNSGKVAINLGKENIAWSGSISAGHYFRAPSLLELFSSGFGVLSNPNLKAEQGEQFELSLNYKHNKTRVGANVFANQIRDRIVYYTSGMLSKPINAKKGKVYGVESEIHSEFFDFIKIDANATFQNAGTLPNEAKEQYFSSVSFMLPYSFELKLEGEAHSVIYRDEAQKKKIPENAYYHLGLSYKPIAVSTIFFYIRNLNGAEYQHIYDSYPTPGRIYSLSYSHYF